MTTTVFDPPPDVIVIGYTWQRGNASGGTREVFVSVHEAKRRIQVLLDQDGIKDRKLSVLRLEGGSWIPVNVRWPEELDLELP